MGRSAFVKLVPKFGSIAASAYEKGYPGYPGIPLSDLKPVGLWRYPEALKRLAEAFRGSLKPSEAP